MIETSKNVPKRKKKGEQQFLKNTAIVIIMQIVCAAFYDPKRNKACQIFIPGDSRMFDKFIKTLKKHMIATGKVFVSNHKGESKKLLNSLWLHRYLQYQESIQDIYDYATGKKEEEDEGDFLNGLVQQAREYVAAFGNSTLAGSGIEGRPGNPLEFAHDERLLLWDFYLMVLNAVRNTWADIKPIVDSSRVDLIKSMMGRTPGTKGGFHSPDGKPPAIGEEIQMALFHNLKHEKLENDEMWWHIRFCIDHEIWDYKDMMINVARNNQWKAWVRQTAVEYACRTMEVGEACEKLLSGLYGKLFYWTVAQFADSKDARLKKIVNDYAQRYNGQEMLRDACLVKMQDRIGLERIRRYLERMKHVPKTIENPDPVRVIGEVKDAGLLDELEKLLNLLLKDYFRDREYNGLRVSLASALVRVASGGSREYGLVLDLLRQKQELFQSHYEECMCIWGQMRTMGMGPVLENQKEGGFTEKAVGKGRMGNKWADKPKEPLPVPVRQAWEAVRRANQKRVILKELEEDVNWKLGKQGISQGRQV